jgi:hypothetical protein
MARLVGVVLQHDCDGLEVDVTATERGAAQAIIAVARSER